MLNALIRVLLRTTSITLPLSRNVPVAVISRRVAKIDTGRPVKVNDPEPLRTPRQTMRPVSGLVTENDPAEAGMLTGNRAG